MRELPPPDELLLPRDHEPIVYVGGSTWVCDFCEPAGGAGSATTVDWIGPHVDGPHGRCRTCGQQYMLSPDEHLPPVTEQHPIRPLRLPELLDE